ncbi:LysR family transcriptional regulator [Sphingomonas sp. Leaf407]|uniref:LysR family transcriptional regulator n=1 Tax=unclassified Sphingomonas TaxID=196159 RepID=UPI0006F56ED4|nr:MULTISPECIES: LysR family transcriptional regulator [unclassified Sphingomonas]KQN39310.1 LysR family transcriptional regulator [Sphingomonas sp. Leaf42]KQT28585.1 LysR family transcriptional regulator [Sphingomonas sp. Leaf407]
MPAAYNPRAAANHGINNLKRLAYFAEVVETGSFTAAAARLGITKAVVSSQVARLEQAFETTLLVRTTRSVRPTEEGRIFYERCARILSEAQAAFDGLVAGDGAPTGLLRLTAPLDYGVAMVVPAIAVFRERFPACTVDLVLSDATLDPVGSDIELAIRVGWLTDSALRARRIGTFGQVLVAGPDHGVAPDATPADLAALPFVANSNLGDPLGWTFRSDSGAAQAVRFATTLAISATIGVLQAARDGAGLAILPDFAVAGDLASGRLVRLLPGWQLDRGGVHAVMPGTRFRPARVTAFLDILAERERRR